MRHTCSLTDPDGRVVRGGRRQDRRSAASSRTWPIVCHGVSSGESVATDANSVPARRTSTDRQPFRFPASTSPSGRSPLSGGERTMTAVALLFAIYMAKPSPFCLMDEVDAALDENNVDRFVGVLREFSQQSQFLIVSHNKRTISAAGTIFGVSMPEPGVSKKIAVRLDDIADDGQLAPAALAG